MTTTYIKLASDDKTIVSVITYQEEGVEYFDPSFIYINTSEIVTPNTHYYDNGQVLTYSQELQQQKENPPPYPASWDPQLGWMDQRPIQDLKAAKQQEIDQQREKEASKPVQYANTLFDADPKSQQIVQSWTSTVNAGVNPPAGFTWRDYYNQNHPADADWIRGLNAAITTRTSTIYQTSWQKKAEVEALTTPEAVKAYDATAGWPA